MPENSVNKAFIACLLRQRERPFPVEGMQVHVNGSPKQLLAEEGFFSKGEFSLQQKQMCPATVRAWDLLQLLHERNLVNLHFNQACSLCRGS